MQLSLSCPESWLWASSASIPYQGHQRFRRRWWSLTSSIKTLNYADMAHKSLNEGLPDSDVAWAEWLQGLPVSWDAGWKTQQTMDAPSTLHSTKPSLCWEKKTLYHRALSLLWKCPSCARLRKLHFTFVVMLAVIYICWVKDNSLGRYRRRQSAPLKIEWNYYF